MQGRIRNETGQLISLLILRPLVLGEPPGEPIQLPLTPPGVVKLWWCCMNDAESQLEQIWAKWTSHPVPVSIQEQCTQKCEPIREMLEELTKMNLGKGNMTHEEAERIGAHAGEITSHFARATFNFGLEYGSKETRQITLDVVREKAEEALPLIIAESEQLTKLVSQLLSGVAVSGAIDPGEVDSADYELGSIRLRSAAMCFQIGMEYSGRQQEAEVARLDTREALPANQGTTNRFEVPMSTSQTQMTAEEIQDATIVGKHCDREIEPWAVASVGRDLADRTTGGPEVIPAHRTVTREPLSVPELIELKPMPPIWKIGRMGLMIRLMGCAPRFQWDVPNLDYRDFLGRLGVAPFVAVAASVVTAVLVAARRWTNGLVDALARSQLNYRDQKLHIAKHKLGIPEPLGQPEFHASPVDRPTWESSTFQLYLGLLALVAVIVFVGVYIFTYLV